MTRAAAWRHATAFAAPLAVAGFAAILLATAPLSRPGTWIALAAGLLAAAAAALGGLVLAGRRTPAYIAAEVQHVASFTALPAGGFMPAAEAMARIEDELSVVADYGRPLCLALLGVEPVADGDDEDLLEGVARLLAGGLRRHDVVGARGPAELLLMLPETDAAHARVVIDRLRGRVRGLARLRVALFAPGGRESLRELLEELDAGLAAAREMKVDFADPARLLARRP